MKLFLIQCLYKISLFCNSTTNENEKYRMQLASRQPSNKFKIRCIFFFSSSKLSQGSQHNRYAVVVFYRIWTESNSLISKQQFSKGGKNVGGTTQIYPDFTNN